jgi:Domain of unknown function (DUF4157)
MKALAQKESRPAQSSASVHARSHRGMRDPGIQEYSSGFDTMARNSREQQPGYPLRAGNARLPGSQLAHWNIGGISIYPGAHPAIQTRLAVNQPGDAYEQEADRIADQVMRLSGSMLEPPDPRGAPARQQRASQTRTPREVAEAGNIAPKPAPPSVDEVLRAPGHSLDTQTRDFMEQRFGYDFSKVRIHTDAVAAQSAREVNANAYTVGHHVVFGARQFAPATHQGRRLIAHEFTHVVQQAGVGEETATSPMTAGLSRNSGHALQRDDRKELLHPEDSWTFKGSFQIPSSNEVFGYRVQLYNVSPLMLPPNDSSQLDYEVEEGVRLALQHFLKAKQALTDLPPLHLSLDGGFSKALHRGHVQRLVEEAAVREIGQLINQAETSAAAVVHAIISIMSVADYIGDISPFGEMLPSYYVENKIITDGEQIDLLWDWFRIANNQYAGSQARFRIRKAEQNTATFVERLNAAGTDKAKLVSKYREEVDKFTAKAARQEVETMTDAAASREEEAEKRKQPGNEDDQARSALAGAIELTAEVSEVLHKLSERSTTTEAKEVTEKLEHAAKEQFDHEIQGYLGKVFKENDLFADAPELREVKQMTGSHLANGLAFLKGGLDAASAIMAVADPEEREKLFKSRSEYFSGVVAQGAEITSVVLKFVSGAVAIGGFSVYALAKVARNAKVAESVLDATVNGIGHAAGLLQLVGVIHGAAVLLDPDATEDEKAEAVVETASSVIGLAGYASRWIPRLAGAAEWSGPIAASLFINFHATKYLLQKGREAEIGMNRLDWTGTFQSTRDTAIDVQKFLRLLAVTEAMQATETDTARKQALEKNAEAYASLVEEDMKPFVHSVLSKGQTPQGDDCPPALIRRFTPMQGLLDSSGKSADAAAAAAATFLQIVEQSLADWDQIIMGDSSGKQKAESQSR